MRLRLPMEVSATILATSTLLIGSPVLNLPTWGIFLGWAATSLAGQPSMATFGAIARTLFVGALCGLATLSIQESLLAHLGPPLPAWAAALIAIVTINPLMLLLGRLKALSVIPGMFIGFSTVLATYFGNFGMVPGNALSAFICGTTMNIIGIGFSYAAAAFVSLPQDNGPLDRQDEPMRL